MQKELLKRLPGQVLYYTVADVAQILSISTNTAYKWICRRTGTNKRSNTTFPPDPIPVLRISRNTIRVPVEEFHDWLKRNIRKDNLYAQSDRRVRAGTGRVATVVQDR